MTDLEKKFWKKVQRYLPVLRIVPFIKLVAVCNNLSFGKINENSDIDLFIVAKNGRLFFVRTFVTFLLQILGVRRYGKKAAGRFCLSFFVDQEGADLSKIALERDIYLAYWLKNLMPLIDDNYENEFLEKNVWAKYYFEQDEKFNLRRDKIFKDGRFAKVLMRFLRFIFSGKFGDFFEKKLRSWQLQRARRKLRIVGKEASILLGEHILKFHNIDRRSEYRNKWLEKFGDSKLTNEKFLQII